MDEPTLIKSDGLMVTSFNDFDCENAAVPANKKKVRTKETDFFMNDQVEWYCEQM